MTNKLLLLFTIIASLMLVACNTPVAVNPKDKPIHTAKYNINTLTAIVETDSESAFTATIEALDNLDYFRTGEKHEDDVITVFARKVGDIKVVAKIYPINPEKSEISIRVGYIGNLPDSQTILSEIQDILI